ncbi:MAG: hypothetical protein ABW186_06495, partial [Rhodanobacteraceae bacterium]
LLAMIPLEYFRAIVVAILRDTYRESRTRAQAVGSFLLSLLILIAILTGISVWVMKSGWWAWISEPEVYRTIAFAFFVVALDGMIGLWFFRGDAARVSARLDAIAADAGDWVQLAGFQLPVVLALGYGLALLLRESGQGFAWVPDATSNAIRSAALLCAAFYFVGKAVLIAHANTASFNATGARVLGARRVQWLIWEKNKDSAASQRNEREAASRRRALLCGESARSHATIRSSSLR